MKRHQRVKREGKVVVLIALVMPVLMGMGAFAIDVGHIAIAKSQLQAGADAAALACLEDLPGDQASLNSVALQFATFNSATGSNLQVTVEGGTWNQDTSTFTATALSEASAVRVSAFRTSAGLYFGRVLGKSHVDVSASAVASRSAGGIGTRFLIDDEMIDSDVPSIQNLASSLGRSVSDLLKPRGFNQGKQYGSDDWTWEDNFLDMPAGCTLSLPTGQGTSYSSNDAALFDIDHPAFPFVDAVSFLQFLMYSETGNDPSKWGTDDSNIRSQLDPLQGVAPVTDGSIYSSFVHPDFIHVSPVTISDTNTLNMQNGVPQVNAKGLRRGLLAFKIIAVGNDVDGNGSVLPELVIEIVDPSTVAPSDMKPAGQGGGSLSLVR